MVSEREFESLVERCTGLPPSRDYSEDDYVTNLMLTVLDFQMQGRAVENAIASYRSRRLGEIRTHADLVRTIEEYANDNEGNRVLAQHLWGNDHWTRAALLRELVSFFGEIGVTTQEALRDWASASNFEADFRGRVRVTLQSDGKRPWVSSLGYAVYNWLVIRQKVETIKPDIHVHRFVQETIGRPLGDREVVDVLKRVADEIGLKAYELDWRIWETQRGAPGGG